MCHHSRLRAGLGRNIWRTGLDIWLEHFPVTSASRSICLVISYQDKGKKRALSSDEESILSSSESSDDDEYTPAIGSSTMVKKG